MKKIFHLGSFLLLISCFLSCSGSQYTSGLNQTSKYRHLYQDKLEEGAVLVEAGYHYSIEKKQNGQYVYKQYYPTTQQITQYHTYSDKKLNKRVDKTIEWFDNGHKYFEGNYQNNQPTGKWTYYYHKHPMAKLYGSFVDGNKEGEWTSLDTLGNIRSKEQYVNGQLDGITNWYNEKGEVTASIEYRAGEKITDDAPLLDSMGVKMVEEMPYIASCKQADADLQKACSNKQLLKYVYKTIKYPPLARKQGVTGMALVGFVIDKDGRIEEVEVKRGLCDEIKAECIRVVKNMPKWNPGTQKGKAVKVYFNLPLRFKLE